MKKETDADNDEIREVWETIPIWTWSKKEKTGNLGERGIWNKTIKTTGKVNKESQCSYASFACFEVMTYYRENLTNKILPY